MMNFQRKLYLAYLILAVMLLLGVLFLQRELLAYDPREQRMVRHVAFQYEVVEIDKTAIVVLIEPNDNCDSATSFADAYLLESRAWLQRMASAHPNQVIDALVRFRYPLSQARANRILAHAKARVFESAVVGTQWGAPFAAYALEPGPYLSRDLDALAGDFPSTPPPGFGASGVIAGGFPPAAPSVEIGGYLAVRVLAPANQLLALSSDPLVGFVDATPQRVFEEVTQSERWRDRQLTHRNVRIEMPVWDDPPSRSERLAPASAIPFETRFRPENGRRRPSTGRRPARLRLESNATHEGRTITTSWSYHGPWPEPPTQGLMAWEVNGERAFLQTAFRWSQEASHSLRRHPRDTMVLDLFDRHPGVYCDQVYPQIIIERGGDWMRSWFVTNACDDPRWPERVSLRLKSAQIAPQTWYWTLLELGMAPSATTERLMGEIHVHLSRPGLAQTTRLGGLYYGSKPGVNP